MGRFLMATLFVMLGGISAAQEQAIAKIHYSFKHINDTTRREQPLRDEVVTYLGQKSSYYTTYTDVRIKEDIAAQKLVKGYNGHLSVGFSGTPIKSFYLTVPGQKQIQELRAIASSFDIYAVGSPYEEQDWVIADELKEIGGYTCQKATTRFKGRNYTAWFTTEIPLPFGPWKLHGLPGLILSAEDDRQEVSFAYLGFDKLDKTNTRRIEIPDYTIKVVQKELDRLLKVYSETPEQYYNLLKSSGRMAIGDSFYGIDYSENTIDIQTADDYKPSFQTNNPLEKSEDSL